MSLDGSASIEQLLVDVEVLKNRIAETYPQHNVDPNILFEKLETCSERDDRVDAVLDLLFGDQPDDGGRIATNGVANSDLEKQVLNGNAPEANDKQQEKFIPDNVPKDFSKEIEMIKEVCEMAHDGARSEVHSNRILQLLTTHAANPDRIQVVIDTLLAEGSKEETAIDLRSPPPMCSGPERSIGSVQAVFEPQPSTSGAINDANTAIESKWNELKDVLPDADPDYLYNLVQELAFDNDKLQERVAVLLECNNYPKLKETLKQHNEEMIKKKYFHGRNFTVEGFLELVDDPLTYYYDTKRPKSEKYKEHVEKYINIYYPMISQQRQKTLFNDNNYSLTACYRHLQNQHSRSEPPCKKSRRSAATFPAAGANVGTTSLPKYLPKEPDETFYKEVAFLYLEKDILAHVKHKADERSMKIDQAKKQNELITCNCCYEDEFLLEDILMCDSGHMFCHNCVRRYSAEVIGQGKYEFPCIAPECTQNFSIQTLSNALKPAVVSKLLQRMQEEEIKNAGIEDLVSCPFCSFCAVMPNPDDKVFKCLSPDCLKESCRLCKEPNHLPLRCDEVEHKSEMDMRTYIENKMTEALLRTCPKCSKSFIKASGCNKMVCACGTSICYVCRQVITGYDHFGQGKCPQFSTDYDLHVLAVQQEAQKAKEDYLKKHPESENVQLKNDPVKNFETNPPNAPNGKHRLADYDGYFSDSSEYSDDSHDSFRSQSEDEYDRVDEDGVDVGDEAIDYQHYDLANPPAGDEPYEDTLSEYGESQSTQSYNSSEHDEGDDEPANDVEVENEHDDDSVYHGSDCTTGQTQSQDGSDCGTCEESTPEDDGDHAEKRYESDNLTDEFYEANDDTSSDVFTVGSTTSSTCDEFESQPDVHETSGAHSMSPVSSENDCQSDEENCTTDDEELTYFSNEYESNESATNTESD